MTNFTLELVTYPYLVYQLRTYGFLCKRLFEVCAGIPGPLTEKIFYFTAHIIIILGHYTSRLKHNNNNKRNVMVYMSKNMGILRISACFLIEVCTFLFFRCNKDMSTILLKR